MSFLSKKIKVNKVINIGYEKLFIEKIKRMGFIFYKEKENVKYYKNHNYSIVIPISEPFNCKYIYLYHRNDLLYEVFVDDSVVNSSEQYNDFYKYLLSIDLLNRSYKIKNIFKKIKK